MRTEIERVKRLASAERRSAELHEGDREARDNAIEEASLAGHSVREIATAAGMSVSRVQTIVIGRQAERQDRLAKAAQVGGVPQGPVGTN